MDFIYSKNEIRKDILNSMENCKLPIVTRFPPEASGHLHIGHGKALFINYGLAKYFNGKMILRYDDTNPENETMESEESIYRDICTLGIKPDIISHTSDHFDYLIKCCYDLISNGCAYVDDTDKNVMKYERQNSIISKNRNNDVDVNIDMFNNMINGQLKACVRLKIDMNSLNKCMRDPTIYRSVDAIHYIVGNKYKIYPTYDFSCPIVDSIENVTHALRSVEYSDREDMYYFVLDKLKLRKPKVFTYGKVNFINVVMSKRKIKEMINNNIVSGWEDPRLPTIEGVINNGICISGLISFLKSLGMSNSNIEMEWDKIYGINRKIIDKIATRLHGFIGDNYVTMNISDYDDTIMIPKFVRNKDIGNRELVRTKNIIISKDDYDLCYDNEEITLSNWGNAIINKSNNSFEKHLDGDMKTTKNKIVWVNDNKIIQVKKYIIPIGDIAYNSMNIMIEKGFDDINIGDYIQILKLGYYKKISDNCVIEIGI